MAEAPLPDTATTRRSDPEKKRTRIEEPSNEEKHPFVLVVMAIDQNGNAGWMQIKSSKESVRLLGRYQQSSELSPVPFSEIQERFIDDIVSCDHTLLGGNMAAQIYVIEVVRSEQDDD